MNEPSLLGPEVIWLVRFYKTKGFSLLKYKCGEVEEKCEIIPVWKLGL